MRPSSRLFFTLFTLVLVSSAAHAEWGFVERDAEGLRGADPAECGPGNLEPITIAGPFIEPGGETVLVIDPRENCSCEFGLDFSSIEATLWVADDAEVTVRATLRTVDASDPACPTLGAVECLGPETTLSLAAGFNAVSIPMDPKCPCVDTLYPVAIGYQLVSATADVSRTANDTNATGPSCTSYYIDAAGGILDEAGAGIPGRLGLSGLADCCNKPVDGDVQSWGGIKGEFNE